MLSIQEYLLLKVSEECNELAAELVLLSAKEGSSKGTASDFESISESLDNVHAEYNDLLAITVMLERTFTGFNIDEAKEQASGIKKVSLQWATTQTLDVAHIVSKCIIFGPDNTYKGKSNINRLSISLAILKRVITLLFDRYASLSDVDYENTMMQIEKRQKVLQFMTLSLTENRIEENTIKDFECLVRIHEGIPQNHAS